MKLYPVFLLGALLVICLRRPPDDGVRCGALVALVSWVALNIPAWITGMDQWKVFWTFNSKRGPDLGGG
ncbi:MAG: hypothetical protein V9E81_17060 [Marmoricola sp.]